jgi:hypothetical protein
MCGGGGGGGREVDKTRSVLDLFREIICIFFSLLVVDGGGRDVGGQTDRNIGCNNK